SFAASPRAARAEPRSNRPTFNHCARGHAHLPLAAKEVRMRKLAITLLALLGACVSAPAYQSPAISLAPAYGVADRHPAVRAAADSCPTDSNATRSTTPVHFRPVLSAAPFWRTLDDSV